MEPTDFTYEELNFITFALDTLCEDSQEVAADRHITSEERGQAKRQVKLANSLVRRMNRELLKYTGNQPLTFVTYLR